MHIPFNTMITKFLESKLTNQWLESPTIKVYVRKGHHFWGGKMHNTFDVANVEVITKRRDQGIFTTWLTEAEQLAAEYGFEAVFVESLLNPHLADFLVRRGYTFVENSMPASYYLTVNGTDTSVS